MVAAAKPKPSEELKRIVNGVANSMNEPPWQSKLLEAMEFVLAGSVSRANGTVQSGAHAYQIDDEYGCTCVDAKVRKHTCKHLVAWEMQKRVDAHMKGETMPAKAKKATPQDEWEAKTQNSGETNEEPALFDQVEPDDIPEPEVPENISRAAQEMAEVALDLVEKTVYTKGYQYTDYPSTLYLEQQISGGKICWTFRGTDDRDVWGRAQRALAALKKAAEKHAPAPPQAPPAQPQQQQPAAPQQAQAQTAPAQATYVDTAAGQIPMCPVHQRPMKPSQYGGSYCPMKNQDGSFCKVKV